VSPAPYTPEAIDRIRAGSRAGLGVNALARELQWDAEFVRRIGRKHQIELIEDVLAKPARKKLTVSASVDPGPIMGKPKPANVDRKKFSIHAVKAHPRNYYVTFAISDGARKGYTDVAKMHGKVPGSVAGIVLDYLFRHDWGEELYLAAIAEIEAQS